MIKFTCREDLLDEEVSFGWEVNLVNDNEDNDL